jgi:hypothetical protein
VASRRLLAFVALIPLFGAFARPSVAEEAPVTEVALDDADQNTFAKIKWEQADPGIDHPPATGNRVITPEPGTIALLGVGLAALGAARLRAKPRS